MQADTPGMPVVHQPIYLKGEYPEPFYPLKTRQHRLDHLRIKGLTYRYDIEGGDSPGISDIHFELQRGSFTVITGRIGSGKTTLLKVLLGLLPNLSGEILWNGEPVTDLASTFRPPRCAYTGQVPRLFSETVRENILLGLTDEQVNLKSAIEAAVLEKDIISMEKGLDTLVGPHGIRLSGGQVQRTAAARMFVREAELLVFDDLSSALDVETERQLWDGIFARQEDPESAPTCLVVSHRRAVLQRADQVILLKNGHLEDIGRLEELLARSDEMRNLWMGNEAN